MHMCYSSYPNSLCLSEDAVELRKAHSTRLGEKDYVYSYAFLSIIFCICIAHLIFNCNESCFKPQLNATNYIAFFANHTWPMPFKTLVLHIASNVGIVFTEFN